ncbi:MAG TPA: hypothetical protein VFW98_14145, partial [Gemmatimonadaceae bacterium]|nr:hypothetical protein [Gemmatimonadaceae bacterium]
LVLTEGVIPYLTTEDVAALANDLASRPAVRNWVVDYFSPDTYKYRKHVAIKQLKHAPFRFWPADFSGFFAEHGWKAAEARYLVDEGERLGRPMRLPFFLTLAFGLKAVLTPRAKRGNPRTFAGFVLMEPVRVA